MRRFEIEEGCVTHHEPAEVKGRSLDQQRLLILIDPIDAKKPFEACNEMERRGPLEIELKGVKHALLHIEQLVLVHQVRIPMIQQADHDIKRGRKCCLIEFCGDLK